MTLFPITFNYAYESPVIIPRVAYKNISKGPIPTLAARTPIPGTIKVAGVNKPTIIKIHKN